MASVNSDKSVAVTLVEIPTKERVKASLDPAYTILDLILEVSGDLLSKDIWYVYLLIYFNKKN